jgi:hypothetical protein
MATHGPDRSIGGGFTSYKYIEPYRWNVSTFSAFKYMIWVILYLLSKIMQVPGRSIYYRSIYENSAEKFELAIKKLHRLVEI